MDIEADAAGEGEDLAPFSGSIRHRRWVDDEDI
jgi:hypothetical protein